MSVNLAPLSSDIPINISIEDYKRLSARKGPLGWSVCDDQIEWLVKLDYLRKGLQEKKISKESFAKHERQLVVNWWYRFV